jgi:uncharacterized damage-inducible protein DinB
MSLQSAALAEAAATRKFFDRTTSVLIEADSGFRATPHTMTVAAMVAHVAQTVDWFRAGAFDDDWRMDFEALVAETEAITSLAAARRWLAEAWQRLDVRLAASSDAELATAMADNPILGARPRASVGGAITDHTAHHRGSLAVFARLLGRVPPMPYAEE